MSQRSPEIHYWMALPMIVMMGFVLHLPLILQSLNLLPSWADINTDVALLLIWSTITGIALSAIVYTNNNIAKPVVLPWKGLQDLLANDFYTQNLYRSSVVLVVALVSQITSWFDRYLVDGGLNLFGVLTLFGGRNLRYSTSGQSQFYMLTIVFGIALISVLLSLPFLSHVTVSLFPQNTTEIVMNVQR